MPLTLTATQNCDPPTLAGGTSNICRPAILQYQNDYMNMNMTAIRQYKLPEIEMHIKLTSSIIGNFGIFQTHKHRDKSLIMQENKVATQPQNSLFPAPRT